METCLFFGCSGYCGYPSPPPPGQPKVYCPDYSSYSFYSGRENIIKMIVERIDPALLPNVTSWLELCQEIYRGLFLYLALPWPLSCLWSGSVSKLFAFGALTVREAMELILEKQCSPAQVLEAGRARQRQQAASNRGMGNRVSKVRIV